MRLPIDEQLGSLNNLPAEGAVIVAPPGTGKSTRVPPALAKTASGQVWVLQPRRLAARLLAARVAEEQGCRLGAEVGYEVRFDRKSSRASKVIFMTAGIFLRKLVADPELSQVSCVIIDEFHERQLDSDLALSLTTALRERRGNLDIIVMSATMDPKPVTAYLGGARVVTTAARTHPVEMRYMPGDARWPLEKKVAAAVRELTRIDEGNILVFLPGKREISRAADSISAIAERAGFEVTPLHGQLSSTAQDRAVRGRARRIVLATNVAETSVTIEDVVGVIDSGLARMSRYSPWTGVPKLAMEPVSRASADQRAGRAGRTRPGTCVRLYAQGDYAARGADTAPEVVRSDLARPLLSLYGLGMAQLNWYERPPGSALEAARDMLERLGMVSEGEITGTGRRALRLPVHPRLARVIDEGSARGVGASACIAAAVVESGPVISVARDTSSDSDVVDEVELFEEHRGASPRVLRGAGLDARAVSEVAAVARQLGSVAGEGPDQDMTLDERARHLRYALCAGYVDRVCRRRKRGSRDLALTGVRRAALAERSAVRDAELMIAVDATELGGGAGRKLEVRRASAVELDWLIELDADGFEDVDVHEVAASGRVERVKRLVFRGLMVDEDRSTDPAALDSEGASAALLDELATPHWRACADVAAVERLRRRLVVADASDSIGDEELDEAFAAACTGAVTRSQVRDVQLAQAFFYRLSPAVRADLERRAPEVLSLPGRRRVPVRYEPDRDPWIESRLQDFFGLDELPRVGGQPVLAHLLAPNRRAVQITKDLAGFWRQHYPGIRKQLMRRYPRHAWPEDPTETPSGG